jgi:curved DNA-binding protein CbpA
LSSTASEDLYELLGVTEDAGDAEIRKNYKRLARELHPDRFVGDREAQEEAQERFAQVSHAFNVLKDATQRSEYDFERKMARQKGLDENISVVETPVEETGYKREMGDRKYKMGLQAQAEGDLQRAVNFVKEAVDLCPNVAQYHALLAALYDRRGWHSYAQAEIKAAIRLDPNDQLSKKLHRKIMGAIEKKQRDDDDADGRKGRKKRKGSKGGPNTTKLKGAQAFRKQRKGILASLLALLPWRKAE